jgi:6-phosphogluconolactonase
MKCLLFICLCLLSGISRAQNDYYMLVGTYTAAGSHGIYVYDFNTNTGDARITDSARLANPSFLAVSPNRNFVYAVSESAGAGKNGGKLASFSFDRSSGKLNFINQQSSAGNNPCYVTADKTGNWVMVGNYSSGTLAVLPVSKTGRLDTAVTVIEHSGRSVNTERQNEPHVHSTVLSPDNKYLIVPDLGMDKVMQYRFDQKRGTLTPTSPAFTMTKAGAGPRHFEFHPNKKFAYLVEELTGGISAYRYSARTGELALLQNISTLPPDYLEYAGSADIHVSPDGKFLYASNRGESNTIAIFSINKETGMLTAIGHQSTLGKTPRNFNFDPGGNFLLAANQNSDEIVVFKIDKATGLLSDTGKRINVSRPVCIKWIKK